MERKLSHRSLVANARIEIRHLKKPAGMRSDVWLSVRELLHTLAGHLPDVWPNQRTLATKLGCSQSSVHRRVSTAVRHGLITTTIHQNESWWDGTEYVLTCLSEGLKADCARSASRSASRSGSRYEEVLPSTKEVEQRSPSVIVDGSGVALAVETSREAGVARWEPDDDGPSIGADPHAPLPSRQVKPLDPAKALVLRFDDRWWRMTLRSRRYVGVPGSKRGMAIGYVKNVMLTQVSEDVAQAHMDAFISAVASGEVELKDEQIPFERFTGWWGRQPVGDPAEEARNRQVLAEMRRRRDERLAALDDDD